MNRSLPDFEVLEEDSLMSILRWSFKANIEKTMSSCDYGHIALVGLFQILLSCSSLDPLFMLS